jgi:hypothetical protein
MLQKEDESAVVMTGKQATGVQHLNTGAEIIALGHNPTLSQQGFQTAIVLSDTGPLPEIKDSTFDRQLTLECLREARFGAFERLLASYVFFWSMAKQVASFPLLGYQHWKSQSRTRIMTTAAPISRVTLELSQHLIEQKQQRRDRLH